MHHHPIYEVLKRAEDRGNTASTAAMISAYARSMGVSWDRSELTPLYESGRLLRLEVENGGLPLLSRPTCLLGEARVARWLARGAARGVRPTLPLTGAANVRPTPSQVAARAFLAAAPMAAPMAALTGRPGTGKTYLTAMIVNALLDAGVPVDVAAPTGKAASVLTLKLDRRVDVVTIHRLIGLAPGQIPGYHQHNQLSSRVVVVDESSMIDSELLGMLLDAIDPVRTFVLLVGDPNQLNPVGYGSPFADLVRNKLIPVAELTEIQRQAGDNGIIQMAHSFADGKLLLPEKNVYHFKMDPTRLKEEAINLYCSDRLKAKFGLESVQKEFLILSPVKQEKYNASTASINEAISHRLLPARDLGKSKFARGDRIIFTVNNYAHGFVNGELGVLEDYSRRGGHARIRNDIGTVYELDDYSLGQYADWAYALTVHKAQGSECRVVALLLEPGAKQMYTRNLVYTAITRAREELLIFGDLKTLEEAAARPDNRVCALPYLVRNPDLSARIIERTQPADLSSFAEDYK